MSNTDLEREVVVEVDLGGVEVDGVSARLLAPGAAQAYNSADHPDAVAPSTVSDLERTATGVRLTLPPHSFAVLEATLRGEAVAQPTVDRRP